MFVTLLGVIIHSCQPYSHELLTGSQVEGPFDTNVCSLEMK